MLNAIHLGKNAIIIHQELENIHPYCHFHAS